MTASIQPATTAWRPAAALVGCCCSFVVMVRPSSQTPPTFDMVAPQSVPMNTCGFVLIARAYPEWKILS